MFGLCGVGGLIGFAHGIHLRHQYREKDLGLQFASSINSATGKLSNQVRENTKDLKLAENYNALVLKGKDAVVAAAGGIVDNG
jgi:hypothetical protein